MINTNLWKCGPLRVDLHARTQGLILQDVDSLIRHCSWDDYLRGDHCILHNWLHRQIGRWDGVVHTFVVYIVVGWLWA